MDESVHFDRILNSLLTEVEFSLSSEEVIWVCKNTAGVLLAEPSLLMIDGPLKICGDIHGQFQDLVRVFQTGGFDATTKYLLLGD
jgi:serine/threonine-protein phosphatase PP1 catalytic subunit